MLFRFSRIFLIGGLVLTGWLYCSAQIPDPLFPKAGDPTKDDDKPKSFQETVEKLRIEKDKKDHDQMVERGEEVVKLSEELEKAVSEAGRLSEKDYSKVATVEKLVKKIRTELGAANDDVDDNATDDPSKPESKNLTPTDAVKSLHSKTTKLYDELKKTTRFTISASAIQASNSVLRLARFLKISH